jgi:hypothetical protein
MYKKFCFGCPRVTIGPVLVTVATLTFSGLFFGVKQCSALENLKVFRGVLILEGIIKPGDYDLVYKFLRGEANFKKIGGGVFIASPGGSVFEAMKIGNLIRELRLSTSAPSIRSAGKPGFGGTVIDATDLKDPRDYQCVSACFFVYVAGIHRNLGSVGRLGLHQPQSPRKSFGAEDSNSAATKSRIRNWIKSYLVSMNVPGKYVDLMYSVPPNALRWITQDEFDSDLKGYISPIKNLIETKCNPRPNDIKINLTEPRSITSLAEKERTISARQSAEILKCVTQVESELPIQAWHKVFPAD